MYSVHQHIIRKLLILSFIVLRTMYEYPSKHKKPGLIKSKYFFDLMNGVQNNNNNEIINRHYDVITRTTNKCLALIKCNPYFWL